MQDELNFSDSAEARHDGALHEEIGYRGATACAAAGITYRQLDYWARTGLLEDRKSTRLNSSH